MLHSKKRIFLALSGGMDSMYLAHQLLELKIPYSIAHCNFRLRGKESEEDAMFVKAFASHHRIPFYKESYDTMLLAAQNKTSIEEEARNLRYDFFRRLTELYDIDAFLTAHHADDQVETILMRVITGTGVQGLQGIPYFRTPNYYRPLLNISRREIEYFVHEHKIAYREDLSNLDTKYKRNKIRQNLVPMLRELNPNYQEAFLHLAAVAHESHELFKENFHYLKEAFRQSGCVHLEEFKEKKYLSSLLQFIFSDYAPKKAEIYQIASKLMTTELKKFECGSIWLTVKKGCLTKFNYPS